MKKTLCFMAMVSVQALFAQTLSLKDAVGKTLAYHPDVRTFMLKIQQAEQGYNAAYADYLPQLNLQASYSPTQTYILPVNGTFHTIDDTGWNAGVQLHQKVWDFAKTSALIEAAKLDEDISRLSLNEVKALLAFKVKSLYELLVVQAEAVRVREKDLETKKAFYAQAQALVKQGLKTRADATRFLAAVYAAEDSLAIARASYEKAKSSLALYMGVSLPATLTLQKDTIKKSLSDSPKKIESDVLAYNYKIQMDRFGVEKGRQLHRSAKAAHYGSIDISASHNRFGTLNTYDTDTVTLSYNIPLYSGGRLSAQEQQAKIGYQIAQEKRLSDEIALKEELHNLLIDIKRYAKTIRAKKAQLRSANRNLSLLKARYKEGLTTYIEVLDTTSIVLNAKLGVLEAYYLRSVALDRIAYLKGEIE